MVQSPKMVRFLTVAAAIGMSLSLLSLASQYGDLSLCARAVCDDPRWLQYGALHGVPLSALGAMAYFLVVLLLPRRDASPPLGDGARTVGLLFLVGALMAGHGYLSWIQYFVLHDWCAVCVACSLTGLALASGVLYLVRATSCSWFRLTRYPLAAMAAILLLLIHAHLEYGYASSRDPLIRPDAPAIYRGAAASSCEETVKSMIHGKEFGPTSAALVVDIFTDFQCIRCTELAREIWPAVHARLGEKSGEMLIRYHTFFLEGHQRAREASLLALAASARNRFLEAHDLLFKERDLWLSSNQFPPGFRDILGEAFLSATPLNRKTILAAEAVIRKDVALGASLGVKAPPSVVIRSTRTEEMILIPGKRPVQNYLDTIQKLSGISNTH